MKVKKVVILGPESSGKTFLSKQLAEHFSSAWVPEYARTYLEKKGSKYSFEDLHEIATVQLMQEQEAENKLLISKISGPLFIDTDLRMIQIWSEWAFSKCDNRVLTAIAQKQYDLFLLCKPDIPWQPDPLRENPDERSRRSIYNHYLEVLSHQQTPFTIISGSYTERFKNAVQTVSLLMK